MKNTKIERHSFDSYSFIFLLQYQFNKDIIKADLMKNMSKHLLRTNTLISVDFVSEYLTIFCLS
jgi:hypothetical protein